MSIRSQGRLNTTSLVLLAIAFVAAMIISNQIFRGWRLDLTENNLYTLSDGTKHILEKIDEPINLYFYFSDEATKDLPAIRGYATRVREMLEQFEAASDGKIKLSVIDPLPFSVDEDRAAQFGLQGINIADTPDPVYMGLAGTNSVDDQETIPFFQPNKEKFLEYNVARMVSALSQPQPTVIGLISGVSIAGDINPQTQQTQPAWVAYQQAQQLFDIRNLGADIKKIDDDVGLLWIVQPKDLPDTTLYAIDQFLTGGGNALIFVDPLAEIDAAAPPQIRGMQPQGQSSDLPVLFSAWGLKFSTDNVVGDAELALQISSRMTGRPVPHPGLLGITKAQMNPDDIVTGNLESVNVGTAGYFTFDKSKAPKDAKSDAKSQSLTFEPLISSSRQSATIPASRFRFLPDPSVLLNDFNPSGEQYVLAARLSGTFPSAFPDGPPVKSADEKSTTGTDETGDTGNGADANPAAAGDATQADDNTAANDNTNDKTDPASGDAAAEPAGAASETGKPANVIVVADVDMLSDRMWVQVQSFFGQQIANAFADNGNFVTNALDSLSGSNDLIAVRSRGSYSRPFTRVNKLQAQAQARFQETEQNLQKELDETEKRLTELQSARKDTGNVLMTDEQQAEISRFIDRRAEIRQELRAVRRNLDKDIKRLGTELKAINIALVPLLLTIFVLLAVWRRKRSRKS